MTDKLKPCPFCGGEAELVINKNGEYRVLCETDGCMNYAYRVAYLQERAAIAAWNNREANVVQP